MTDISVVVATYNRAGLIGETLDSILRQSLQPAEVIVVDDGSTDETKSVLSAYAPRVRSIYIPNSGDMVARNIGLNATSTELVGFCDSDDLWEPEFLATSAVLWKLEPLMTACYSNFRIIRGTDLSSDTKFDSAPKSYWSIVRPVSDYCGVVDTSFVEHLLSFQPFFPSCLIVRKQPFVAAGGWDEGVSRILGCDFATALRVAALPPVGIVNAPLVAIRKHEGNISGNTEAMNLGDAKVLDYILRTRPQLAALKELIGESIADRRRAAFDSAFARRDFAEVCRIYSLLPSYSWPPKQRVKYSVAAILKKFITVVKKCPNVDE